MTARIRPVVAASLLACVAGTQAQTYVEIFPPLPSAASNVIPFGFTTGNTGITVHQVFASSLFSTISGGQPVEIDRMAVAPTGAGTFNGQLAIRLGYTSAIPGVNPPAGLDLPDVGGGGAPNANGPMHTFYNAPTVFTVVGPNSENFQFIFEGTPFVYDPSLGNLLMEIQITDQVSGIAVSRANGSEFASRTYRRINGTTSITTTQAHRTEFRFSIAGDPPCYANCDGSTVQPVLNIDDFTCFINEFATGLALPPEQQVTAYANCDGSTTPPALNIDDFTCFINAFAQGCP